MVYRNCGKHDWILGAVAIGSSVFGLVTPPKLPNIALIIQFPGIVSGGIYLAKTATPSRLARKQAELAANEESSLALIEQEQNLAREQLLQEAQEKEAYLQGLQQRLTAEANLMQQQIEEEFRSRAEALEMEKSLYEGTIYQLQAQLAAVNAPKIATGVRYIDHVARQVQEVILSYEVRIDYEDSFVLPGENILSFSLGKGIKRSKLEQACQELPHRLKGCLVPPTVEFMDGYCLLTFAVDPDEQRDVFLNRAGKKMEIVPPPPDWFKTTVKESFHFLVTGRTGSGKSELFNNIICVAINEIADDPSKVEYWWIDPKMGSSTHIEINGVEIIPQYQNYNPAIVHSTFFGPSQDGVIEMGKAARNRLELGADAKRNHRKAQEKSPQLWVFDEAADLMGRTPEEWETEYALRNCDLPDSCEDGKGLVNLLKSSVKSALRLGRSEKIICLIAGQSDLVSTYKLNKPDILNCAIFFLGLNAARGIEQFASSLEEKKFLKQQLALYRQEAATNPAYRYYGLVVPMNGTAFLAIMPPPKMYSRQVFSTPIYPPVAPPVPVYNTPQNSPTPQNLDDLIGLVKQGESYVPQRIEVSYPADSLNISPSGGEKNSNEFGDLNISHEELTKLLYALNQNWNQEQTIQSVWGLKKGGYKGYKEKVAIFQEVKNRHKVKVGGSV